MKAAIVAILVLFFFCNCFWAATDYANLVIATRAFQAASAKRDSISIQIAATKQDMHRNNFLFECTWFLALGIGAALIVTRPREIRT